MKKLEQLIDTRSEYFRICPYCEIEFMADHMSTKFCSETCGDCYNNAKKRFNRSDSGGKEVVSKPGSEMLDRKIEANISILNTLIANPNRDNYFTPEFLIKQAFDFDGINGRTSIVGHNTGQFMLRVGPYRITRTEKNNLCIKSLKLIK